MEKYKKTIKIRCFLLAIVIAGAAAFGVYDVFFAPEEIKNSEVFGFQCGLTLGLGMLALALLMRYARALKNEKQLRKQYNMEHDERMQMIRAKAGMPILLFTSCGMLGAAVIAGYSDVVVFKTLVKAAVIQLIISCTVKIIYTLCMNGEEGHMKLKKRWKKYVEGLFTLGLILSALFMVDRAHDFIPSAWEAVVAAPAIVLLLGAGTVKHIKKLWEE